MKKRKLQAILAALLITGAVTATAIPVAIYAIDNNTETNIIAVNNELAETKTEGRSLYTGCKTDLDIQTVLLDKLGYKDDKTVKPSDVTVKLTKELTEDKNDEDMYIESDADINDVLTIKDDTMSFSHEGLFVAEVTVKNETKTVIFDVDDEIFGSVDLNEFVVKTGTKNPDFLSAVSFDEEKVKDITISDSEVNVSKAGEYLLTYKVTDIDNKTYEKSIIVTVGDNDTVNELEDEGLWVATTKKISINVPSKSDTTKKSKDTSRNDSVVTGKPSASDKTSGSNKTESGKTETTPVHQHKYDDGVIVKAATCTEDGTIKYTCVDGDDSYTKSIPATGHAWNDGEVTVEPGCETDGIKVYTCTTCGEMKSEAIPAVGHTFDECVVTTEPTCTEEGVKTFTCTICGDHKTEAIPAVGHTWNDGEVTVEPTCTETGIKTFTCTVCGDTKTEVIDALGHTWDEGKVTTEPTCETDGVKTYTCDICGDHKTESVPALGHAWDEGTVTTEPTCTEDGVMTYTCTRDDCDATRTEAIEKLGHDYVSEVTKPATCAEEGVMTYTCSRCGDTYTEVIPKTDDHKYNDGVVTKEPTCTESGIKTYTCTVCGKTYTEEIPALGHSYTSEVTQEPTCATPGVRTYTCTRCGNTYTESIPTTDEHTWDSGVVTKQPTCTAEGVKTYTCTVCGDKKTEAIPVVEHSWEHHDAVTHEEIVTPAWDEQKAIWKVVCNGCGAQFDTADEAFDHIMSQPFDSDCQNYSSKIVGYDTIHHDAVTKTVVDVPAYDECSVCGKTR